MTPNAELSESRNERMSPSDARKLVIDESTGESGILVQLRMGRDPGADRMERLFAAIRILFDVLHEKSAIDRGLASALHQLDVQIESQVNSWETRGKTWREALVDEEVPKLALAVESIFSDEWFED